MRGRTATPTIANEILTQEKAYLTAVEKKDGATVARLTAAECIVLGAHGVRRFDARAAGEMARQHDGKTTYAIDDGSLNILPVDDNTAVIAYKLRSETPGPNGSVELGESFDTSVWVRKEDGRWACALHAEAPVTTTS